MDEPPPTSARWPPRPAATTWRTRSRPPWRRAPGCSTGGTAARGAGYYLSAHRAGRHPQRLPGVRRRAVRPGGVRLPRSRTSTRPSRSPTTRASGWAPRLDERRGRAGAGSSPSSTPATSSSTRWSRPTRACPSAASRLRLRPGAERFGIREFVNVKTVVEGSTT